MTNHYLNKGEIRNILKNVKTESNLVRYFADELDEKSADEEYYLDYSNCTESLYVFRFQIILAYAIFIHKIEFLLF